MSSSLSVSESMSTSTSESTSMPASDSAAADHHLTLDPPSQTAKNDTLSGTGTPGDTIIVNIFGRGHLFMGSFRTRVGTDGTWSVTDSIISVGQEVDVTEYGPDGSYVGDIDNAPIDKEGIPSESASTSMSESDSNHMNYQVNVDSDTTTSDNDTISGTGLPGTTITVTIYGPNGDVIGTLTTTVGSNGTWSVTNPTLRDASYVDIKESSSSGNTAATLNGVTVSKHGTLTKLPQTGDNVNNSSSIWGLGIFAALAGLFGKRRKKDNEEK